MTTSCVSLADPVSAERRVREWLAEQFEVEYVKYPPESLMYGLDSGQDWVFRIHDPSRLAVGAARYLSVNRATGRVTDLEAGE